MKILRRVPFLREIALLARRFADAVLDDDAAFDRSTSPPKPSPRVSPETPFANKGPPAHWLADIAARAPHLVNDGEIVANAFTSFDLRNDATTDQGVPPSKPRVAPAKPAKQEKPSLPAPTTSEPAKREESAFSVPKTSDVKAKVRSVVNDRATPRRTETSPPVAAPAANRQAKPVEVRPETPHKTVVSPDKPVAEVHDTVAHRDKPTPTVPNPVTRDTFVRKPSPETNTATRPETSVPQKKSDGSVSAPPAQPKTHAPVVDAPQPQPSPHRTEKPESTVWPDPPPQLHAPTKWPALAPTAPQETNAPWVTQSKTRPELPKDPTVWQPKPKTPHRVEASPRKTTSALSPPEPTFVEVPAKTHESTSWPEVTTNVDESQEVSHAVPLEQTRFYEKTDPWPMLDPRNDAPRAEPNILTLELLATRSARLDKEQRGSW